MIGDQNKETPSGAVGDQTREKWLPRWSGRNSFWKKCLVCFALALMEWKLGLEGRPVLIRLQELAFLFVLCRVAMIDARTRLIPDRYVTAIFVLAGTGFLASWLSGIVSGAGCLPVGSRELILDHLTGLVSLSLPLLLLAVLFPGSMGGGDIKLLAAGGFYMGVRRILPAFFLAMVLAGTAGTVLVLSGRRKPGDTIPLGPFLCIGMTIWTFFGD